MVTRASGSLISTVTDPTHSLKNAMCRFKGVECFKRLPNPSRLQLDVEVAMRVSLYLPIPFKLSESSANALRASRWALWAL